MSSVKHHLEPNDDNDQTDSRKKFKSLHYVDPGLRLLESTPVTNAENIGCVTLKDIIRHDHLESMYQFNFTVNLEFLMDALHPQVRNKAQVTVIHGHRFDETRLAIQADAKRYPNVRLLLPTLRDKYGTHHTKAMVLFFNRNGVKTARLVVSTANLCHDDWEQMTQGVYMSPMCPLKQDSQSVAGTVIGAEYGSEFERHLISYFQAYGPDLSALRKQVALYDWSQCKAILIGSVPGYHRGDTMHHWGLGRLAQVLRTRVKLSKKCCEQGSTIVAQCSSFPGVTEKWFDTDFGASLGEAINAKTAVKPMLKFIYPTAQEVRRSCTGIVDSAGFLRLDQKTFDQHERWMKKRLCRWKSEKAGRQIVMPHIKTYARITGGELEWFLLTSANLSRAAWGQFQKEKTQIYIKSYELGVLFCRELFQDLSDDVYLLPSTAQDRHPSLEEPVSATIVPIRLPYDIPISPYGPEDECYTRGYASRALEDHFGSGSANLID
ncbi:hypothetical protein LRAMOSA11010 [Lichtheimia ramosa]|uniref:Tyrosyl-DNA phosphodiesterase n=1 Tax=Lichtheimia ramosa TaxID=688394 RepID=A0A077WQJ8_9FUNG|nr:hypothetical protein LRAMOSA11010 [Lichtheimia ramosa]